MKTRFPFQQNTDDDIEINMTPMLDVVFILLIFFIVTTSFIREAGVNIDRPEANTSSTLPQQAITVAITAHNKVWIDQRQIEPQSIRRNIERLLSESPESTIIIQADKFAQTGLLIEALDQCKLAGARNIAVATTQGSVNEL
jgi:biopolymer transport protein ExbD